MAAACPWPRSDFADLPQLAQTAAGRNEHWLVFAGGVALILSRASRPELETRFAASLRLYLLLRGPPERGTQIDANLVNQVMHEIAAIADPMTRAAGRVCLQVCQSGPAGSGAGPEPANALGGAPGPTGSQAPYGASTQLNASLLNERSRRLRTAVASARISSFASSE